MDLHQGWRLARRAVAGWQDDGAQSMGASLAYYTLFSLAPLLLIITAVAGFVFGEQAVRGELASQLAALVGDDAARAVEVLIASAARPRTGFVAMAVGVVALLAGASTVFAELQSALDRIWRAPARTQARGVWTLVRTRVVSFGMILAIAFLLMVSLFISALVSALGDWWGVHALAFVVSFALVTVLFALIYKVIPRVRIAWRDVWTGAAVTSALFALGKIAIGLYLGRASVTSVFGAAGSLVAVMVWVYYSAQIFLLGAEFTREYATLRAAARLARPPAVTTTVRVRPAANVAPGDAGRPGTALVRLGAALALGVGAGLGLNWWRRR